MISFNQFFNNTSTQADNIVAYVAGIAKTKKQLIADILLLQQQFLKRKRKIFLHKEKKTKTAVIIMTTFYNEGHIKILSEKEVF